MKFREVSWDSDLFTLGKTKEILNEIRAVRLAVLHRGRNAYHTTWVQHYLKGAEIFSDLASAKLGAEEKRAPGNKFYITEVPGLLLRSNKYSAVFVDANEDRPFINFVGLKTKKVLTDFGEFVRGIYPGIGIFEALEIIGNELSGWNSKINDLHLVLSGEVPTGASLNFELSDLRTIVSLAEGADYLLSWSDIANKQEATFAKEIEEEWVTLQQYQMQNRIKYESEKAWSLKVEKNLVSLETIRDEAEDLHSSISSEIYDLEFEFEDAELELDMANQDRMRPAETSSEIAQQRLRVEAAQQNLAEIKDKLVHLNCKLADAQEKLEIASQIYFEERLKSRDMTELDLDGLGNS
jgi:hypothetical protein